MLQTHVPPACFAAPFSLSALPSLLSLYITSTNLQVSFPHKYGSYLCFPPPFLPAVCWRNLRLQFTKIFSQKFEPGNPGSNHVIALGKCQSAAGVLRSASGLHRTKASADSNRCPETVRRSPTRRRRRVPRR